MSDSKIALADHFQNSVALLFGACAISFVLYKLYKEGVYSLTGLIISQAGLWFVTIFMLMTLN